MNRELWSLQFVAAILFVSILAEVAEAMMSLSRAGCGRSKLCVETPNSCDPSGSGPCLFASAAVNQSELMIGLRGESEGYIALGFQPPQSNQEKKSKPAVDANAEDGMSLVFVCGKKESNVFSRTMMRNNMNPEAALTPVDSSVWNFTGSVNGSVISCWFSVPLANVTKGSRDTNFTLQLGTGTVARDSSLGVLNVTHTEGPLDLMNVRDDETTTTAAPTTAPPALSISRTGCGQTKLCVANPESCDPSGSGSCLFTSASVNQSELSVGLRGDTEGYIALGLTNASQEMSLFFVCGKRNGAFFFETAQRNNSVQNAPLTKANITVGGVRGEVKGNVTKCLFKVQSSDLSTKIMARGFAFALILGTGPVNGNGLGSLTEVKKTMALDLSKPNANLITVITGAAVGPVAPIPALILSVLFYAILTN